MTCYIYSIAIVCISLLTILSLYVVDSMGVYFIATVCFVPGSILTLGIGFVLGKAVGLGPGVALATGSVFVGASAGAIVR